MKMQILYDTQQELNRLFIAGSKFAAGDPRLLKLVPVFEKMGEKVPVFKKIAGDLQELTQADPKESSARLLALGTLLYSILYTQGEALEEPENRSEQQPVLPLEAVQTRATYSELHSAMWEIGNAKSERLEALEAAHARGIFTDFRTFPFLNSLLDDRYSALAEYAETVVIPAAAGAGMVPILRSSLELDDRIGNVRRLRALIQLADPDLQSLIDAVFAASLPGMQVAAIPYLAQDEKNEDFLLKLAADKKKDVRESALLALADLGSTQGLELVVLKLKGANDEQTQKLLLTCLARYQEKRGADSLAKHLQDFYDTAKHWMQMMLS